MKIWAVKYTLTAQVKSMCGKHRLCLVDSRQKSSVLTFHHRVVISLLLLLHLFFTFLSHAFCFYSLARSDLYIQSDWDTCSRLSSPKSVLFSSDSRGNILTLTGRSAPIRSLYGVCISLVFHLDILERCYLVDCGFKFSISTLKSNLSNTTGRLVVRVRHRAVRSALSTPPRFSPRD